MQREVVVVGAGFKGICACLRLIKDKNTKVYMIDASPVLGGIMYSRQVNGFAVDNGVQMFDSIPQQLADTITEVMDGEVVNIDFVSESAFNGVVTQGFSLPDLASVGAETRNRITGELISIAANNPESVTPESLGGLFRHRYGRTAGGIFCDIFERVYGGPADQIEPYAIDQTSMGRLKHLDDPEMLVLKNDPWLDTVLAARRKAQGKIDDFVSIYPGKGGMREFCERVQVWLRAKGVDIGLKEKISSIKPSGNGVDVVTDKRAINADLVVWANDNTQALTGATGIDNGINDLRVTSSMVLMTLCTQADSIKDFTYLQNFDPNAVAYRVASAGKYSHQSTDDGLSFVTCECPAVVGNTFWEKAEDYVTSTFEECVALGVLDGDAILESHDLLRAKITHRLPKVGFGEKCAELVEDIGKMTDRILVQSMEPFNRRQIYLDSESLESI